MTSTSKAKVTVTYADVLKSLNTPELQADLDSALEQLSTTVVRLVESFECIAKQLHTIEMSGSTPPFKKRWSSLRKEFRELLWNYRSNASFISGRLKMFCSVVLPLAARNSTTARSHDEKLQVLGSFMSISADHATLTRNLVGSALKFNNSLNSLHTDVLKFASQRTSSGQQELRELANKLTGLENTIRQLCNANAKHSGSDVTHFAFAIYRVCAASKRKASWSRTLYQRLLLTQDLVSISKLYEQLDHIRNEVAHAQYTAQVCHRKTDALTTAQATMSTLVSDEMISIETGLSLFLSIWSRLHADCTDILHWLQNPRSFSETPGPIIGHLNGNYTLYATVADSLDTLVVGIDPSHFAQPT